MPELLLVLLVLVAVYGVVAHNRFVRQQHLLDEAWAQVEVELQRRQDLVQQLVEAVASYREADAAALASALSSAQGASGRAEVVDAEDRLTAVLHRLPPGPWERLQEQLAETEDRIAAARRFYEGNARALSVRIDSFPSALVARATGVERPEPLDALDREPRPDLT